MSLESSLLQTITATALIGTQRQPFTPITTDGNLGQLLANIDTTNQEAALLSTVAIVTMYQQAGQLPITNHQLQITDPCELDDLPRCSDRTGYYLSLMLNGEHQQLLPELLDCLADLGQRVHETSLPSLLDLGKRQSDVREAIVKVLGKRGQWLAAQNPEWNYVASEDEVVWETGSKAARLMWLTKLRRQEPVQARQLLESTWKQESASDRTAFLEVLGTGLSMADEPFLEALLDDRSKEVRRVTVDLLTCLSESRFCQRAIARVQNLVKLQNEGNQPYFTVDLPEVHTPEMLRDGIESKSNDTQIGDRASWLLKMLTSTPLSFWYQHLARSMEDLVKAANHSQSDRLILQGWIAAAQKTGDLVWLQALVEFSQEEEVNRIAGQPLAESLILDSQQQAAAIHLLKNSDLAFSNLFKSLLFRNKTIWNEEVSEIVLEVIITTLERFITTSQLTSHYWGISEFVRDAAKYISLSLIPAAKEQALEVSQRLQEFTLDSENKRELRELEYMQTTLHKSIKQFVDLLQIRQEMLESISEYSFDRF
ncbi:DUF5691 domain-containing protein [Pseudanabaena sp. ABRG5-3]|uniref:DUF5691 domain-containing protein n=1 Tax=Pseudanabaena sp. ABRG5-3 TaxID=685565 RepID=UPI000DC6F441|nr:DUF5691 domain-containing protein [Pseudanabaena sp. ABRG5-3]BBC26401.1 hypothetical protein ABRG53_4144 [Pseudanabaena sp. ABRG5-3]